MFDQPSFIATSIDFIILVLIYVCLYPALIRKGKVSVLRFRSSIFLVVLFCVLAMWSGDWFHYQEIYHKINEYASWTSHMEGIYDFLMRYVCPTYLTFRFVVWGAALAFFYLGIKKLGLRQDLTWAIFGLGFLPYFSYARVSIVPAMIILGAACILAPNFQQNKQSVVCGLLLMFLSVFCHKSAFFGVAIMLFCFVVPQTNKNSWFYFLIGFVVASLVLKYLFMYVLSMDFSEDSALTSFAEKTRDSISTSFYVGRSVGPLIVKLAEHIPYFLTAILAYRIQNEYQAPKTIMTVVKFEFYMVLFSMFFLFDLGTSTSLLYGRFLRFSILPGVVTLAYAYEFGLFKRYTKFVIWFSVCCSFYQIIYEMYCKLIEG